MSAFILDDTTTSRLAQHLLQYCDSNWKFPLQQMAEQVRATVGDSGQVEAALLAVELHRLNCYAVDQRYGTGAETSLFRFDRTALTFHCSEIQLYKFAECWLYQCSEGDADQKPLFEIVKRIKHSLASSLIRRMPEYTAAKWA
jgi:hypothetical protein